MKLPTGTVSLLFTDIEGSTRMLRELGRETYVRALEQHRRLLREAFGARGGVEVEMQGDSFHFAFQHARDAVLAAAEAQRALAEQAWEAKPVRVRIGVHTGEPAAHDGLYAGLDVHRAARVMSVGHGGQVLVSETTALLVRDELPEGLSLRDLGEYRLKDIPDPEHLVQLEIDGLRIDFPPPLTLSASAARLPAPPTPIVGRRHERAELRKLFTDEGARLVTVTGPGGVGKTRLALEVAHDLADRFADGVYFVALASLQGHELVLSEISQTLQPDESPDPSTLESHLRDKRLLLVLDNFEHVREAAPRIGELLAAAARVAVLTTSREPLHLSGEHEYALDPLALPKLDRLPELDELARIDAVALFLERARAVGPELGLTARNAGAVAEICVRLDGLPLALELAAARLKLLSPTDLLVRLERSLPLLERGPGDAPERQRTLRATIDWSHDLLAEREQVLFRRLAVFAGGCTLEAAERVCDADLDALESLVGASVLRVAGPPEEDRRFSTLRVIREYAADRLAECGEAALLHGRHLSYFLDLALDADARMTGAEQSAQLRRVATEHDNFRAALAWGLDNEPERALFLATRLQRYFYLRGHSAEGLRALEDALERTPDAEVSLRARALRSAGTLADGIGDFARARSLLEAGLELFRALGEPRELAVALNNLGAVAFKQTDLAAARACFAESLALKRELGDRHGTAMSLSNLGMLEGKASNPESARASQEEALAILRELGDESGIANALTALAEVAVLEDDPRRARALLDEALPLTELVGDHAATVEALSMLARASLLDDEPGAARELAARSAALARDLDDAYTYVVALEVAADVLLSTGELARSVGFRATASRLRSKADAPEWPGERRHSSRALELARDRLGAEEYERAWAIGLGADPRDALAGAASEADSGGQPAPTAGSSSSRS